MTHPRTQLRTAAVAALTGLPTTGPRVFVDREYTLQPAELPCLHVATSEGTVPKGTFSEAVTRTVELRVRLLAKTTGALSNLLDKMAMEVEGALVGGLMVGGKLRVPEAYNATEPNPSANGDQPVAEVQMGFTFQLFSPVSNLASLI